MTKEVTIERIREIATGMLASAEPRLAKFKEKFEQSPVYAFEWAAEAIAAAGEKDVAQMALAWTESEKAVPQVVLDHLASEALREAQHPASSTSPVSNLTKLYVNAARAKLIARVRGI